MRHIPAEYELRETEEHLKLALYINQDTNYFNAMLFKGKQQRPLWHYRFKTEEAREKLKKL